MQNPIPNSHRTLAGAVNIASIFFPYTAPIVGFIVGFKLPFVRFHALKSLIEQIALTLIIGVLMIISISWSIYTATGYFQDGFDWNKIDWVQLVLKTIGFWLLIGLFQLLNTIQNLKDAYQAFNGLLPTGKRWTERLALKWNQSPRLPS